MNYIITIDCGTTNMRGALWARETQELIARSSNYGGVLTTVESGSNAQLAANTKKCIDELSQKAPEPVSAIFASGMITSELGLVEIEHLVAPVGIKELAAGIQTVELTGISELPINFIPGLKNFAESVKRKNFASFDMMRGEEVETIALLPAFPQECERLFVLPGTHTKFVFVNYAGKIAGSLTSACGEILDAITKNTLVGAAVGGKFVAPEEYDREAVIGGFRRASRDGIGRACSGCRVLRNFGGLSSVVIANYILGVVFQGDAVLARRASRSAKVVVAGKEPLRSALADVLAEEKYFHSVEKYVPQDDRPLAGFGALLVAEEFFRGK